LRGLTHTRQHSAAAPPRLPHAPKTITMITTTTTLSAIPTFPRSAWGGDTSPRVELPRPVTGGAISPTPPDTSHAQGRALHASPLLRSQTARDTRGTVTGSRYAVASLAASVRAVRPDSRRLGVRPAVPHAPRRLRFRLVAAGRQARRLPRMTPTRRRCMRSHTAPDTRVSAHRAPRVQSPGLPDLVLPPGCGSPPCVRHCTVTGVRSRSVHHAGRRSGTVRRKRPGPPAASFVAALPFRHALRCFSSN